MTQTLHPSQMSNKDKLKASLKQVTLNATLILDQKLHKLSISLHEFK